MERPIKRPRFAPAIELSDEDELGYYETPSDEVEREFDEPEDFDPVQDLQQKRAQLDYKLKSKFESIFEKYGRDFDGVGDEIDLATGEIVVNNGHLIDMRNERDAGEHGRARNPMRVLSPDTITSSSVGPDYSEMEEDVGDSEDGGDGDISEEDMIEDDLILRGFAQATRFIPRQLSTDVTSSSEGSLESLEAPRPKANPRSSMQESFLPSRMETSPFGHGMDSHPFDYVKEQRPLGYIEPAWRAPPLLVRKQGPLVDHIEPAWRAPPLAPAPSTKRPKFWPVDLQPQIERSPSPESATSLWAAPWTRRPKARPVKLQPRIERSSSFDNTTSLWDANLFVTASSARHLKAQPVTLQPQIERFPAPENSASSRDAPLLATDLPKTRPEARQVVSQPQIKHSSSDMNAPTVWSVGKSKLRIRNDFTKGEEEALLDFVAESRRQGYSLSSQARWKQFGAMYPRHTWGSWYTYYRKQLMHISSSGIEDSEIETSGTSDSGTFIPQQKSSQELLLSRPETALPLATPPISLQRPTRIRKPAQRDPTILSWADAVAEIESADPLLHAGLLEDVRRTDAGDSFRLVHPLPESRVSEGMSSGTTTQSKDEQLVNDSKEKYSSDLVPCPHANCRHYPLQLYRLRRNDDEELSPMCLHLLHVHHTTPFPCGEFNCDRKGDHGFFMQTELVRHVKEAHPYATAIQRLRGRVDSALLDPKQDFRRPLPSTEISGPSTLGAPRDSDFMSGTRSAPIRYPPSGQSLSTNPTQNEIPTPNQATGKIPASDGASLPRSSSSTPTKREKTRNASSGSLDAHISQRRNSLEERKVYPCPLRESHGCEKRFTRRDKALDHAKRPHDLVINCGNILCPYKKCGKIISTRHPSYLRSHLEGHKKGGFLSGGPQHKSASKSKPVLPEVIPNSQSPRRKRPFSAPQATTRESARTRRSVVLPQNTIPSSYEFSDEEDLPPIVKHSAKGLNKPAQSARLTPPSSKGSNEGSGSAKDRKASSRNAHDHSYEFSDTEVLSQVARRSIGSTKGPNKPFHTAGLTPSSFKESNGDSRLAAEPVSSFTIAQTNEDASTTKPPLITASAKPKRRRRALRTVMDDEDLDELSLGPDDFIFIASRRRSDPQSTVESARVKEEGKAPVENYVLPTQRPTQKQRLVSSGSSDVNELGGPTSSSAQRTEPDSIIIRSRAKQEIHEQMPTVTPIINPTKRKRGRPRRDATTSSSQPETSPHIPLTTPTKHLLRRESASTPLLNLAKSLSTNKKDTASQATIPPTPDLGSPVLGLATPARRRYWESIAGDEEGVVKTPGGTLRRCGEDGFTCGRSFCFKCGSV